MTRKDVSIYDTDTAEEIAQKLSDALNWAHELRGPVMVSYRGEQYAMVVPPDAGLAWARAEESGRLSEIATQAAGLAPSAEPHGSGVELR
jgi:hypothetical protein